LTSALTLFGSAFTIGALVAIALTFLVRPLAVRVGVVAKPSSDRWHRTVVPLLGGVAVWGGVAVALCAHLSTALKTPIPTVFLAASALFIVGLVDDVLNLKPSTKLTAQIATACLVMIVAPHVIASRLGALDVLLAIVWVAGITNAFNLLDNMDGVCAGVTAIAAVFFALAMGIESQTSWLYMGALAGAATGFLIFNFNPASIFLGDSGSLFIGASFALLSLSERVQLQSAFGYAVAVPVLILLLPIFDTAFVTISRKLASRPASVGGRDHTSHRLVTLGFSERQTSLLLYGLAAAGGGAAAALRHAAPVGVALALLVILALCLLSVVLFAVVVYDGADLSLLRGRRYTPLLVTVAYKRRLFEVLLDVGLISIAYFLAYVVRFDAEFFRHQALFEKSLPIIIVCQLSSCFAVGVYRGVWRYISIPELTIYVKAVVLGTVSSVLALVYLYHFEGYSRGVFAIYAMSFGLLLVASRLSFRLLGESGRRIDTTMRRALIYGAGDAGVLLVRELQNNHAHGLQPVGFLDDDASKSSRRILGIRVVGTGKTLDRIVSRYRADVIVMSTKLSPDRARAVAKVAAETGIEVLQFDFRLRPVEARPSAPHEPSFSELEGVWELVSLAASDK
jgi:UDP-GlcNAc:undecaprenyl-phosphate GlcNAc-1-phosphate transferase